jgi:hypothetical protein
MRSRHWFFARPFRRILIGYAKSLRQSLAGSRELRWMLKRSRSPAINAWIPRNTLLRINRSMPARYEHFIAGELGWWDCYVRIRGNELARQAIAEGMRARQ